MSDIEDIAAIKAQEAALVFDRFDDETAFEVGSRLKRLGQAAGKSMAIDVRFWDRQVFFFGMGTTADNLEWIRRKANIVKRFHMSSYRFSMELARSGKTMADRLLHASDYALAGGGVPITIANVGVVGAVVVSGLPQRLDHGFAVQALAEQLGIDPAPLALKDL